MGVKLKELTKEIILNLDIGFEYRSPLLIKKYKDFRLSLYQNKQKSSKGWLYNVFVVHKRFPHGKTEFISNITYKHELESILRRYNMKTSVRDIMETQEKIKVMQAYVDGKDIQYWNERGTWIPVATPTWDWTGCVFRINPEPQYVPYTSEDLDKMDANDRVILRNDKIRYIVFAWDKFNVHYYNGILISYTELLEIYTHLDGRPFGKLKE